jgi:hypothetical protein
VYLFRWNQAVEAARIGARAAAVSDPVSSELSTMTGLETGVDAGDPVGAYLRVCTGGGACTGGTYSAAAFSRIFHGPGSTACGDATNRDRVGMCDAFDVLKPANVTIQYQESGADTAGVTGALRPLITVRVSGAPSGVVVLDQLFPGAFRLLPAVETTTVSEDLKSAG